MLLGWLAPFAGQDHRHSSAFPEYPISNSYTVVASLLFEILTNNNLLTQKSFPVIVEKGSHLFEGSRVSHGSRPSSGASGAQSDSRAPYELYWHPEPVKRAAGGWSQPSVELPVVHGSGQIPIETLSGW